MSIYYIYSLPYAGIIQFKFYGISTITISAVTALREMIWF